MPIEEFQDGHFGGHEFDSPDEVPALPVEDPPGLVQEVQVELPSILLAQLLRSFLHEQAQVHVAAGFWSLSQFYSVSVLPTRITGIIVEQFQFEPAKPAYELVSALQANPSRR